MKRTFEEQCKRMQQTLGQDTCPFDGEELDRRILTATQAQGTHSATLHRRRILQLYGKTAAMLLILVTVQLLAKPTQQCDSVTSTSLLSAFKAPIILNNLFLES